MNIPGTAGPLAVLVRHVLGKKVLEVFEGVAVESVLRDQLVAGLPRQVQRARLQGQDAYKRALADANRVMGLISCIRRSLMLVEKPDAHMNALVFDDGSVLVIAQMGDNFPSSFTVSSLHEARCMRFFLAPPSDQNVREWHANDERPMPPMSDMFH